MMLLQVRLWVIVFLSFSTRTSCAVVSYLWVLTEVRPSSSSSSSVLSVGGNQQGRRQQEDEDNCRDGRGGVQLVPPTSVAHFVTSEGKSDQRSPAKGGSCFWSTVTWLGQTLRRTTKKLCCRRETFFTVPQWKLYRICASHCKKVLLPSFSPPLPSFLPSSPLNFTNDFFKFPIEVRNTSTEGGGEEKACGQKGGGRREEGFDF